MVWISYIPLIFLPIMALWFSFLRFRTAIQNRSDDLRKLAAQIATQTQQLISARKAATESLRETSRRMSDMSTLRARVTALTEQVSTTTLQRDELTLHVREAGMRATTLAARLAKEETRRAHLERELAAVSLARLELLSKLRAEASQRVSAVDRLRRPILFTDGAPDSTQLSPAVNTPLPADRMPMPPRTVSRSPSDSALLALNPDLALYSSSSSDDETASELSAPIGKTRTSSIAIRPPAHGAAARWGMQVSPHMRRRTNVQDTRDAPLQLHRAPWVDGLHPTWRSGASLTASVAASTLHPPLSASSPGLIAFAQAQAGSGPNSQEDT